MKTTCALCGWRDATTLTDWDDRPVVSCAGCAEPVVDDPPPQSMPERVLAFVRAFGAHGLRLADVAHGLEAVGEDERNAVSLILSRLSKAGRLAATGARNERVYRPAGRRAA